MPEHTADFESTTRVYWEDTDAGGVVFYANYLKYFERARTEWLRSLGFGQERLRTEAQVLFVVTETSVRYLRPARLDDLLRVTVLRGHTSGASMTIDQQAWRDDVLLCEGHIRIACVAAGTFTPCRIPTPLMDAMAR